MDDPLEVNRRYWDDLAALHADGVGYDAEGFLDGGSTITWLECEGVGDVEGADLPHLHCHFGLDTLSWLREGAESVLGVDFSPVAIERAGDLAERTRLADRATFVESDLYDCPAGSTAPRRRLHLLRRHQLAARRRGLGRGRRPVRPPRRPVLHRRAPPHQPRHRGPGAGRRRRAPVSLAVLRKRTPAFRRGLLLRRLRGRRRAHRDPRVARDLGSVVTALIDAGLRIECLEEHPFACFEQFPGQMRQRDDGFWEISGEDYPLTFSLRARKPAGA